MELRRYVKEESIGNPAFFCGREQELKDLLQWVKLIPQRAAKSRALMATQSGCANALRLRD